MVNVAINGFGRIGRNTLRAAIEEGIFDKINYVAINDPGLTPAQAAHIFKYDSVQGKFCGDVEAYDEGIIINGKKLNSLQKKIQLNYLGKILVLKLLLNQQVSSQMQLKLKLT